MSTSIPRGIKIDSSWFNQRLGKNTTSHTSLHVLSNTRSIVTIINNCTHLSILKYEFTTKSTTEMN